MRLVVTLSKSLTDAEVCQFDTELATGEKQIRRLEVRVYNTFRMERFNSWAYLKDESPDAMNTELGYLNWSTPAPGDVLLKVTTVAVLHDQVQLVAISDERVDVAADVRVRDTSH